VGSCFSKSDNEDLLNKSSKRSDSSDEQDCGWTMIKQENIQKKIDEDRKAKREKQKEEESKEEKVVQKDPE
jgi:hypothetical protein